MNGTLCRRQIELHELAPHLFHRDTLGLVRQRMPFVDGLIQSGTGATAQLFGAQRGNIDEQEPVRHGRRRLDWLRGLGFFLLRY